MSDKFGDFNAAARMREAMRAVVRDVLNTMYPPAKYATCVSVDPVVGRATLRYPGETDTFSLPYGGLAPLVGSTVRVAGSVGARYVDEVFNRPLSGNESPLAALKRVGIISEQSDREAADGADIHFAPGTQTNPSIAFNGDKNTGFFSDPGVGVICTVNGIPRHYFYNTGLFITAPNGSGTNAHINGFGQLVKQTSTERHKSNITPLSDEVLCEIGDLIEIVTYTPNPDHSVDDPDKVFLGAIAERVEELLTQDQKDWLVVYDDEGQCESLKYELFGLVSIAMSRRNQTRMDALEERIAALESHRGGATWQNNS